MAVREKYEDVVALGGKLGIGGFDAKEEGGKLVLRGTAPHQLQKDLLWDGIKKHAGWEGELVADIKVAATDIYGVWEVKSGESLSKIAKSVYDDGGKYMKIFEANKGTLKDPNVIHPGQKLTIPNP